MAAVRALHPILTESVTNIVGRAVLLAGFGVLASLLCHAKSTAASGGRTLAWLAGLMLAAMAIYDVTFGTGFGTLRSRARWGGYLAAALPVALFLYVRSQVLAGVASAPVPFTDNPPGRHRFLDCAAHRRPSGEKILAALKLEHAHQGILSAAAHFGVKMVFSGVAASYCRLASRVRLAISRRKVRQKGKLFSSICVFAVYPGVAEWNQCENWSTASRFYTSVSD